MKYLILFLLFVFVFSGCSLLKNVNTSNDQIIPVKKMGLMLNDSLRIPSLKNKETGILTFTNLNKLEETEPLGRYLQEKMSYHLFKNGFRLKELRLGKQNKFIPKTGEINITRLKSELKEFGYGNLQSIVIGTYIDAGKHYYVNVKLIELKNSLIRASGEMKVIKGEYLNKLVDLKEDKNNTSQTVYERFPITVLK